MPAASCLVTRMSAYGLGRTPAKEEQTWVETLKAAFAKDGYNVPALMKRIAAAPAFYRVTAPETKTAPVH